MKFKNILEARKNPDKNIKVSAYEELKKYKDDSDIYISFRSINKIGINPHSRFNTPNGVYAYPLKEIWNEIERKKNMDNIPYAGMENYIFIIRSLNKPFFIKDMYKDYSSAEYDRDVKKIKEIYFAKDKNIKIFGKEIDKTYYDDLLDKAKNTSKEKSPIFIFWNLTRLLAELNINKIRNTTEKILKPRVTALSKSSQEWNNILRKIGYTGFSDKSGYGVIHPSEPISAVFLTIDAFKVEKVILNKNYFSENLEEILKKIKHDSYTLFENNYFENLLILLKKNNKTIMDSLPELNNKSILQIIDDNNMTKLLNNVLLNDKRFIHISKIINTKDFIEYLINKKLYKILNNLLLNKYINRQEFSQILKNNNYNDEKLNIIIDGFGYV